MKNRINKNYSFETILKALIITNFINILIKRMGLPILVLLLSLFFFQNLRGENAKIQSDQQNIEIIIDKIP